MAYAHDIVVSAGKGPLISVGPDTVAFADIEAACGKRFDRNMRAQIRVACALYIETMSRRTDDARQTAQLSMPR